MRVVVSDTSPVRYLVLIGEADLFQKLYGRILIPQAVWSELQQPHTPGAVRAWIQKAPVWAEMVPEQPTTDPNLVSDALDSGERAAIALALHVRADLLLIDERAGATEARRLGFTVTGTLGILARAAERSLIDLPQALRALRQTNFRASPELLQDILMHFEKRSDRPER